MAKFLKDTPVYISCTACFKTQRAKLKWAMHHKALKCKDCKETIDLKAKAARRMIAATLRAVRSFERTLKTLRKQSAKSVRPVRPSRSVPAKKARRASPKPAVVRKPTPSFIVPPQEQ
jgi:hypothetical protein